MVYKPTTLLACPPTAQRAGCHQTFPSSVAYGLLFDVCIGTACASRSGLCKGLGIAKTLPAKGNGENQLFRMVQMDAKRHSAYASAATLTHGRLTLNNQNATVVIRGHLHFAS